MKLGLEARAENPTLRARVLAAVLCLAAAALGSVAAFPGCSNQGEGQRCSTLGENGGNDDCASNLRCTKKDLIEGAQDDLCCPEDLAKSTVAACKARGGGVVAPPPNDAGTD